jgi:hypothetical protein
MKKFDFLLKQFCSSCSYEELNLLYTRLNQKYQGDLAEALKFIMTSKYCDSEINSGLEAAKDYNDFFLMIDLLNKSINKEYEKRNSRPEKKTAVGR